MRDMSHFKVSVIVWGGGGGGESVDIIIAGVAV